jgi:hypothetical protein
MTQNWQWDWWWGQDGQYRPRASVLYGLWLYAYYTNDWTVVTNNWTSIKSFYNTYSGQGNMYGTMSIHIAMARMAHKMNDGPVMQTAVTNADRAFQNGLLFSTAETAAKSYYRNQYTYFPERRRYHGWVFLNLVPEVARYINDNEPLKNEVLLRHQLGISTFSKWYVPRAWYENGISGHESSGIPSEIIGMMFPVERWIVKTPSTQLIEWRNALPASIGDSYVIEASILAIESTGTTIWVDSRDPYTSPSNTPRMKLGDGNADSKVDGIDYIIWLNHYNQLITGSKPSVIFLPAVDTKFLTIWFLSAQAHVTL